MCFLLSHTLLYSHSFLQHYKAWNKVFFELQCIGLGTVTITIFYALLLASAYLFSNIETKAGYFLLPTCGWVSVATALQYSIYFKN